MNWSKMMKINDVQQILDITNSEWNIYYELITTSLKTSTLSHMPFFNQIDNITIYITLFIVSIII